MGLFSRSRLAPDQFADLFPQLWTGSAFRFEQFQDYDSPEEAMPFERFREGRPIPTGWRDGYLSLISGGTRLGKTITRVRVVEEPWSEYTAFELQHLYPQNITAGENVRVVRRDRLPTGRTPDFWLVDHTAYVMDYDGPTWVGVTVHAGARAHRFTRYARDVAAASRPLNEYLITATGRTA